MHEGIKRSQPVKIDSPVNEFYSEEIKYEELARFKAEMLASLLYNIPIQFRNKNEKATRNVLNCDIFGI
jgi:hypothetical protein